MAKRVLVTGGTGTLGRAVVERLGAADVAVRATSRSPRSESSQAVEWVQVDLVTGAGLPEALAGVSAVIHAVNSSARNSYRVNVLGLERLLGAAAQAGVEHVLYPSIVGIEQIPLGYYKQKLMAEQRVMDGPVPWTILRATQFYDLVDRILRVAGRLPVMLLPTSATMQPVDVGEVAQVMADQVGQGPGGRVPDFAGPQVLTAGELATMWLTRRGMVKRVIPVPIPGKIGRALRAGALTAPEAPHGAVTWADWLAARYGGSEVGADDRG